METIGSMILLLVLNIIYHSVTSFKQMLTNSLKLEARHTEAYLRHCQESTMELPMKMVYD